MLKRLLFVVLLALALPALAAVKALPWGPKPQFVDANGAPMSSGTLTFYAAGTSTPQTTYTTQAGSVANSNPITLNVRGETPNEVWLTEGLSYKLILKDSSGSTVWTVDNISGINDSTSVAVDEWKTSGLTPTYVSGTSFTVAGDQTVTLHAKRRLKTTNSGGTIYSSIETATFGAGVTTITVTNDSGALDAGLSALSYGLQSSTNTSMPAFRASGTGAVTRVFLNKGDDVSSVRDYGAKCDGTTNDRAAFNTAQTGAAGRTLYVPKGDCVIGSNLTMSGVVLMFERGGRVLPSGGVTLTLGTPIMADEGQIFAGSGTVSLEGSGAREIRASWFGFDTAASAATNQTAILAALGAANTTVGPKVVTMAPGTFNINGFLWPNNRNVVLRGSGPAYYYGLSGTELPVTILKISSAYTGGYGIKVPSTLAQPVWMENFMLDGNSVASYGIRFFGSTFIRNVHVKNTTAAGFRGNGLNSAMLENVSATNNTGDGLLIDQDPDGTAIPSTIFTVRNSTFRQNSGNGMTIKSANLGANFSDIVSEGNAKYGLELRGGSGTPVEPLTQANFTNIWLENNATDGSTIYYLKIDSASASPNVPAQLIFDRLKINGIPASGTKAMTLLKVEGVEFRDSSITQDATGTIDMNATDTKRAIFINRSGGIINSVGAQSYEISNKSTGTGGLAVTQLLAAKGAGLTLTDSTNTGYAFVTTIAGGLNWSMFSGDNVFGSAGKIVFRDDSGSAARTAIGIGAGAISAFPSDVDTTATAGKGVLVKSPDGLTSKRLGIDNAGALSITAP